MGGTKMAKMANLFAAFILLTLVPAIGFAGDVIRMKNETLNPPTPVVSPDTRAGSFAKTSATRFSPTFGRVYYILQFAGPIRNEWKQQLGKSGVEIGSYLPD